MLSDDLCTGNINAGIKQTTKAVENNVAEIVYIAKDADEKITAKLRDLCKMKSVKITYIDTMKKLGKLCNLDVGAAVACIIKQQ